MRIEYTRKDGRSDCIEVLDAHIYEAYNGVTVWGADGSGISMAARDNGLEVSHLQNLGVRRLGIVDAETGLYTEEAPNIKSSYPQTYRLPDGSGFACSNLPLPKRHWIYDTVGNPPMPYRTGVGKERAQYEAFLTAAAKYAIKAATLSGKEMDFDPDALIQNLIVGYLGYQTVDGLKDSSPANYAALPPRSPDDPTE